jgi:hypothetical protein
MANSTKKSINSFYRVVKAQRGHPFSGLYAVEKVIYRNGEFVSKQIVHEWDLRIISESILARLGGQDAYESFKYENDGVDLAFDPDTEEIGARKPEDLELTKRKLSAELKLKADKDK